MKAKLFSFLVALLVCASGAVNAQITVTSPATGATIQQCSDMSIYFTGATSAIGQIYKNGVLVATTNSLTGWGTNGYTVGNLTPGNDYQLKVIDSGNPSIFGWSGIFSIIALQQPVSTAATSVSTNSAVVNWNAVSGATDYRIDISTASDFSSFVPGYNNISTSMLTGGTTSKVVYSNILAGTTYHYRLRTVKGSCTSSNSNFITFLTKPSPPVLTLPTEVSNKTTPSSFVVNWNNVQSASEYWVDVSTSSAFSSYVYQDVVSYTNSHLVTGLSPNITHYVRVRAKNSSGLSAYSSTFTVSPLTVPVTSAATYVGSTGFHANWYSPSSRWDYLDLSTSSTFSSFVPGYNNYRIQPSTYLIVSGLQPNTIYYYRVRTETFSGISVSSNVTSQITLATPVVTASEINLTGFKLSWPVVTSATEYEIDLSTSSTFATFTTETISATSLSKTGLPSGVTHYARVRAKTSIGVSQNASKTIQLQAPPVAGLATSIVSTGFTANCTPNIVGSVVVFLDVSLDANFGSFVSPYNNYYSGSPNVPVTGLSPGTIYYYRFRQVLTSGQSANSNTMTVLTRPAIPVLGIITDIDASSFKIQWSAIPTATSYNIQVSKNPSFTVLEVINPAPPASPNISGSATSWIIQSGNSTAFTNNTTYYTRIRANNGSGPSDYSSYVTATTGNFTPTALPASTITNSSFQANWVAVSGSSGYNLDVSTDNTFTSILPAYNNINVSGTNWSVTGLAACTNYFYRLRSVTPTGFSKYSTIISATTSIAAPLIPTVNSASEVQPTSFQANWSVAPTGCATVDYRFDVATDPSFTTIILNNVLASVPYYTVTGLTNGVTYYYRVRASNSSGTSGSSTSMPVTTGNFSPLLLAPSDITNTSFMANWQPVAGAISYTIDVSPNPSFTPKVTNYDNRSVSGTSQNVVGLTAQTVYHYRIRSLTPSGYSITNASSVLTAPNPPSGLNSTQIGSTSFTANWTAMPGITEYEIDVSTDINFTTFVGIYNDVTININSLTVTGLTPSTPYYFRVRAKNSSGSSPHSSVSSLTTLPPQPIAIAASGTTATSFIANWNAVAGALSYRLDVSTTLTFNVGTFLLGYNDLVVTSTSQTVSGLTGGTTYYYRVRAVHSSGTSSASNTITTMTSPIAPTGSAVASANGFSASWGSVPTATEYRIDVSTSSTFVTFLPGFNDFLIPGGLSYSMGGLTPNTQYYFRLRAKNAYGTSVSSTTVPVTTQLSQPVASLVSGLTNTSFTINWTAISGATEYRLDVATNNTFTSGIIYNNQLVLTTSQLVSGLTENTNYYFRIKAYNTTNSSAYSNTYSQFTLYSPPTASAATVVASGSFVANWGPSSAGNFQLDVSTNIGFTSFVSGYNNLSVFATSRLVSGLSPATQYYYRVRAVNSAGASANSSTITATTLCAGCRVSSDAAENPEDLGNPEPTEPSLYPNAVEGQLNIALPSSMKKDAKTSFRVYDLSGREFQMQFIKNSKEEFEADVSALNGGMYILSVETENSQYKMRFLKK